MQSTRNKFFIIVGLIAVIIIIGVVFMISNNQSKGPEGISLVTVTSPFTHTSTTVTPYYKADYASGDQDLVNTQYAIFPVDGVKLPGAVKNALQYGTPTYLANHQLQNSELVFIHLDVDSVHYKSDSDFSFNFYTDSPEQYFNYTSAPLANSQSSITIKPIGGGR